jgi:methyl-accepting chemotaxis protein
LLRLRHWPAIEKTRSPTKQISLAKIYGEDLKSPTIALDNTSREIATLTARLNAGVDSVLTILESDRNAAINNRDMIDTLQEATAQLKDFRGGIILIMRQIADAMEYQGDVVWLLRGNMTTISEAAKRIVDAYQVIGNWENRVNQLARP